MGESLVHCAQLWLALVSLEIGLKLLLGSLAVEQEFLPRTERQTANIAVGDARGGSNESDDLKIAFWHNGIIVPNAAAEGWGSSASGASMRAICRQEARKQ